MPLIFRSRGDYHVDRISLSQQTSDLPRLVQCWPSVTDAGPALNQHWVSGIVLLGFVLSCDACFTEYPRVVEHALRCIYTQGGLLKTDIICCHVILYAAMSYSVHGRYICWQ